MLRNISSDKVYLYSNFYKDIFNSSGLERTFPNILKNITDKFRDIDKLVIINGPWSFTTIRVCTLSFNLLNSLKNKKYSFLSISKIELYQSLYNSNFLPQYWFIFIWQRKNVWLYDFQNKKYEPYPIDNIKNFDKPYFIDKMFNIDIPKKYMIDFIFENNNIFVSFQDKLFEININNFENDFSDSINPNYLIEPNISQ